MSTPDSCPVMASEHTAQHKEEFQERAERKRPVQPRVSADEERGRLRE